MFQDVICYYGVETPVPEWKVCRISLDETAAAGYSGQLCIQADDECVGATVQTKAAATRT